MGWVTMSCREQPSEAFSPALPRLEKKGRGKFTARETDFTPHTPSLPLLLISVQQLGDHTVKWKRLKFDSWPQKKGDWHVYPLKPPPQSEVGWHRAKLDDFKNKYSSHLLYFAVQRKRRMDAAGKWCSIVVLKVLPWLFHHISSFCAFANEFNDPEK